MRRKGVRLLLVWLGCVLSAPALSMEIEWVRTTGHWPIETSPLVTDIDGDGRAEILAVNRGGQVMLWALDGSAIGKGEDGTVVQLPKGKWTTTATWMEGSQIARLLVCSVEGLVVALDRQFQIVWRHQLPGTTTWGRAIPARVERKAGSLWCFGDESGAVTALAENGDVIWTRKLDRGPCRAPPQSYLRDGRTPQLLVAAGTSLCCLDATGNPVWHTDLGGQILSRPEVFALGDKTLICCSAGSGLLFGLSRDGEILWKAPIGDEVDASITLCSADAGPLVLCTGVWGSLHAFRTSGEHAWTHRFRSKNRGRPLIFDANGDGTDEILVSTHRQHVYIFDTNGRIIDDVRLNGLIAGSPAAIPGKPAGVLAVTASLLAYRLRPSLPTSPYHAGKDTSGLMGDILSSHSEPGTAHLQVRNPMGGLTVANASYHDGQGRSCTHGAITARSAFEVPTVHITDERPYLNIAGDLRPAGGDPGDRLFPSASIDWFAVPASQRASLEAAIKKLESAAPSTCHAATIRAWSTLPYAPFDDGRLEPVNDKYVKEANGGPIVVSLYADEADQGAFIVASTHDQPIRARVTLEPPALKGGTVFGGRIVLREVVPVGTINGEQVFDALPALDVAGLITIQPARAVKLWVSVDARGARPGRYEGRCRIAAINPAILADASGSACGLPLLVDVLPLRMPREFPLKLCTWDYVPNKLLPSNTVAVLDDMTRHGVNIFPRGNCIPKATADAAGKLTFDWPVLDAELEQLKGRGTILFQLGHPPITFASPPTDEAKRKAEIAYLRAFRDRLQARGLGYEDYALYPVDEPGLDYGNSVDALIDAGRLFREADPKLRVYTDPVPTISWRDFEQIEPYVDVWCPNMRLVSGLLARDPRMERIMKSGKPVWSYECVGQVKSLSPLCYNRANAWRARHFGLSGIGFWTHSQTPVDPWQRNENKNDEYALVYPGDPVVPSVRWEAVRDGLEDVAAIALLEDRMAAHRRAGTKGDLVKQAEEAVRIAKTDVLELSDEAFVESRDFLRKGDRRIWHTWTDVECFDRHRARIAELTIALGGE